MYNFCFTQSIIFPFFIHIGNITVISLIFLRIVGFIAVVHESHCRLTWIYVVHKNLYGLLVLLWIDKRNS